jgi:hypothetical protein
VVALRVAARGLCLRKDLHGLRVVLNTLQTIIFSVRAQLSVDSSTLWWPATRFEPSWPMLGWTHTDSLTARLLRVLAGRHLFRCSMEGRRQVISGPTWQVEQIFRSTALLNPALALTHPHIVVLLSATRVCLTGQARPKPSTRSRLEGGGDLRDLRQRGSGGGAAHPLLALHTCSAAAPVCSVHGGGCCMLVLLLQAYLPLWTVHLWRVVLWLEYFWRVRYAAISLLVPVGELPPLQSTSKRI